MSLYQPVPVGSSIGYFKRKISPTRSEQLCSWDSKGATCETRGREFKSQTKRIFCVNFEGLGTGCFTRYQRQPLVPLWGYRFLNRYQRHSPTGAKGSFSNSVNYPLDVADFVFLLIVRIETYPLLLPFFYRYKFRSRFNICMMSIK